MLDRLTKKKKATLSTETVEADQLRKKMDFTVLL